MSILLSRWRRLAAAAAAVAAAAGITLGVTTLLGVTFSGGGSAPAEDVRRPAERDRLAICVEALSVNDSGAPVPGSPAVAAQARAAVESTLATIEDHPLWEMSGYPRAEQARVDVGCPSPPLPLISRTDMQWYDGLPLGYIPTPYHVTSPSPYKIFVFVLPSGDTEQLLGGTAVRVAPQEYKCDDESPGSTCSEVTTAVYVDPQEIEATPLLDRLLRGALGLERR
jgi:hypothetical protein